MKHPLMSAMDLVDLMEKLGVMSEYDKYYVVQSDYIIEPLHTLGRLEPVEFKEIRKGSIIEDFVDKYKVRD